MNFSNNKNQGRKFLQEKGYYIVLFLCVLAVGISGYIFVSTAVRQNKEAQQLSVPVTVDKLPGEKEDTAPTVNQTEDPETTLTAEQRDAQLRQAALAEAVTPLSGEVIREFSLESLSYNETTKDWRLHAAVDIAAEQGQVVSCMAGTVTEITKDPLLGQMVTVTHDGGLVSRYAGLAEEVSVQVGDSLRPGDAIGLVGEGALLEAADPGHLHFELLLYGEPMDPAEVLS